MHLLSRLDAHQAEPVAYDLPDRARERQPRAREFGLVGEEEALLRIVVALVPQSVEGGGEIAEIEGDAVRLVRGRGALDDARVLRGELDEAGGIGGAGNAVTVTDRLIVAVAPSSSVTVSATV